MKEDDQIDVPVSKLSAEPNMLQGNVVKRSRGYNEVQGRRVTTTPRASCGFVPRFCVFD